MHPNYLATDPHPKLKTCVNWTPEPSPGTEKEKEMDEPTDPDLLCAYFDATPSLGQGKVSNDFHHAGEGPLYFFVPVGDDAVRVPVCERHAAILEERFHVYERQVDKRLAADGQSPGDPI
jgi:hypothetical protein